MAATQAPPAVIDVPDTLVALQALARARRRQFQGTVVAITGSNGKTTVKEMSAAVLQQQYTIFRSPGNLNNHIGLPLALLRMPLSTEVAVFEMGMNHLGEIAHLCTIARPHIGVVTNVALAHVGPVGSIMKVQEAKGELVEALDAAGVAVLNADDPRTYALRQRAAGRVITFGQNEPARIRGRIRTDHGLGGVQCDLECDGTRWAVHLPMPGAHNIMNALAAVAVGTVLGVSGDNIVSGLQRYTGIPGRMTVRRGRQEVTLIDDTYNANPQSMQAALQCLAQVSGVNRRLAVLGDMLELGHAAPACHREIGAFAVACGVDHLIVLGALAQEMAAAASAAGMPEACIHATADRQEALDVLAYLLRPRDLVLVKGSRGMAMEYLVEALAADAGGK
jgi:UDP-N-acetylmuramoyl-tripeptide--D-alanyl-D-alanine ligase